MTACAALGWRHRGTYVKEEGDGGGPAVCTVGDTSTVKWHDEVIKPEHIVKVAPDAPLDLLIISLH